jgi:hypothetical protein
VNGRARKHDFARLDQAPKHQRARAGLAGKILRESRSPIFKSKSSLKTPAIASNAVIIGVRDALCTTGRSSKGQLQQQRVMWEVSLKREEDEAVEGFCVEVEIYRIEVLFGWFPTSTMHCPLARPNPMPC